MTVTQQMTDAAGEPVKSATTQPDMQGIVFLETESGWTIYHPEFKKALKRRFATVQVAREYAIDRFMDRVTAAGTTPPPRTKSLRQWDADRARKGGDR